MAKALKAQSKNRKDSKQDSGNCALVLNCGGEVPASAVDVFSCFFPLFMIPRVSSPQALHALLLNCNDVPLRLFSL